MVAAAQRVFPSVIERKKDRLICLISDMDPTTQCNSIAQPSEGRSAAAAGVILSQQRHMFNDNPYSDARYGAADQRIEYPGTVNQ